MRPLQLFCMHATSWACRQYVVLSCSGHLRIVYALCPVVCAGCRGWKVITSEVCLDVHAGVPVVGVFLRARTGCTLPYEEDAAEEKAVPDSKVNGIVDAMYGVSLNLSLLSGKGMALWHDAYSPVAYALNGCEGRHGAMSSKYCLLENGACKIPCQFWPMGGVPIPRAFFYTSASPLSPPDHLDNKQAYHAVATMDTKFHEWLREGGARIIAVECAEVQEGYRGLVANAAIAAGVIGVVRMSSSFPHSILKMKEIAAQQVIFL